MEKSIGFSNESINRKMKLMIGKYSSRIMYSLGIGGFLALYIIVFFRINIVPNLIEKEELYTLFIDRGVININPIEINILLISMIAIIVAPLLSNQEVKRRLQGFFLVNSIIFELICVISVFINAGITKVFILGTTITSIYFVWIAIEILTGIYSWIIKTR